MVLYLGPFSARDSTIWPEIDPVHSPLPVSRLWKIEEVLQHHKALMASAAAEAQQAVEANGQAFAALAALIALRQTGCGTLATLSASSGTSSSLC